MRAAKHKLCTYLCQYRGIFHSHKEENDVSGRFPGQWFRNTGYPPFKALPFHNYNGFQWNAKWEAPMGYAKMTPIFPFYEKEESILLSHRDSCLVTSISLFLSVYHPLTQNDFLVSSDSLHMTLKKHNSWRIKFLCYNYQMNKTELLNNSYI